MLYYYSCCYCYYANTTATTTTTTITTTTTTISNTTNKCRCCYKYCITGSINDAYPPCGLKRSLSLYRPSCPRAVSMYQQCNGGVNNTRSCSDILLKQATVDCLAASGTSLIDHYNRCLAAICDGDTSALGPTLAYIDHNCGGDGKSQALVVVLYIIFLVV